MAGNVFGTLFKISTFGESHGKGIGVVIDGCPAGLKIDLPFIQSELERRKPGQSKIVTQRKEGDEVEILSGVFEGIATGTPIAMFIKNKDQKSKDYSHIADKFRPSHADFTYFKKYGLRDYRGGGRSSARETAARVAAGAIAKQLLSFHDVKITAWVSQVGHLKLEKPYKQLNFNNIEKTDIRCPDLVLAEQMINFIKQIKKEGDTIGGVIQCVIKGCPVGLGEPAFDKLHAELGKAMLSINAVKGFEYGSGFAGVEMRDENGDIKTQTNFSGGIQGGISNGMDIYFKTAFKPVATLQQFQPTVDEAGKPVDIIGKGRHDPCVVPRAVPIVEAMAALVLADFLLRNKAIKLHETRTT
ncbi:UNVERIFIED_CONTAM: hypothetical protein GTU68_001677 [Idotea baltica]|nr:hypothetical protein [Idotea baltica]